jgi:hypothetical protein
MSSTAIFRIWQGFGLQPHRVDTFKLSNDPLFIEQVRDIVGLYLDPPEAALELCVDEKAQIQALDRTSPSFPCGLACLSGEPTTTPVTAPARCLRRSTWPAAR